MKIELKDFLPFATSLFGAFFGAVGAYWVGRFEDKRDEIKRQHSALIETQYALYSQWSVLEDVRINLLNPYRENPQRHLNHKQYIHLLGHMKLPLYELTFIIDSEEANLLQEIHIAEKRFLCALEIMDRLNKRRFELQEKYPPYNFDMSSGRGHAQIPPHEIFLIKELTDILYNEVDEALPVIMDTNRKVFGFIKKHFKGKKGMDLAPIETNKSENSK